jgi:hypothetical protein
MKKRCADCGRLKDASEFYKCPSRPDGLYNYCRSCHQDKEKLRRAGWRAPKRVEVYDYLLCRYDLEEALEQLTAKEVAKAIGCHHSIAGDYKSFRWRHPEFMDDDQLWMHIEAWLREEVTHGQTAEARSCAR